MEDTCLNNKSNNFSNYINLYLLKRQVRLWNAARRSGLQNKIKATATELKN